MTTWHQTIIVGNLGRDPELRYLQSGTAVCNLNVAVSESWNDRQSGERREKTTWYRVAVWGAQAENCNQYLSRGSRVLVTGTVSARGYTNNAGEAAASLELRARDVRFMSSRQDDAGGYGYGGGQAQRQRGGGQDDFAAAALRRGRDPLLAAPGSVPARRRLAQQASTQRQTQLVIRRFGGQRRHGRKRQGDLRRLRLQRQGPDAGLRDQPAL